MTTERQLVLCDLRKDVVNALQSAFAERKNVIVKHGDILQVKCDAFATAGNSFGDMGGGVDKAINDFSKGEYERQVQERIRNEYFGELPVGSAIFIQAEKKLPGLIYAPTMRVPGRIDGTINAYLAMRAILATMVHLELTTVACVAMGTGVGAMPPEDAAEQMLQAYKMVIEEGWRDIKYCLQAPYAMRG